MGFLERGASGSHNGSHLFRRLFARPQSVAVHVPACVYQRGYTFKILAGRICAFLCPCSRSAQERQTLVQTDAVN